MATSEITPNVSTSGLPFKRDGEAASNLGKSSLRIAKLWIIADGVTVFVAAALATFLALQFDTEDRPVQLWLGSQAYVRSIAILTAALFGFAVSLILTSLRLNLYASMRLESTSHEQRLSVQSCLTASSVLISTLYLCGADDVPRCVVVLIVALVTISQSLRRLTYRMLVNRSFKHGVGTRNAFIVGTGPEAQALRHHLETLRHHGYSFKGFISYPGSGLTCTDPSGDIVGTLETLFEQSRRQFVDEIFVTAPFPHEAINELIGQARTHDVDVRVVLEMPGGLIWNNPIEYIGQFPTIPIHCRSLPDSRLILKRALDITISSLALLFLWPLFTAIAIAIKLDSKGPVFYSSERIGKKGRVFRCIKFRTMVTDAERRRDALKHLNERDGVLFKIADDPRITRLGRFLRKYSLDELPQFRNTLSGDMSVVGPRPPLADEVKEYKLSHLRRLDVTPGITGLWQVRARHDPSFDSYISLDMAYIEQWSIWLDLKIILQTIGVVIAGTGS